MLRLILQENSFQFIGRDYLQIHGTTIEKKNGSLFRKHFYGKDTNRGYFMAARGYDFYLRVLKVSLISWPRTSWPRGDTIFIFEC